MLLGVSNRCIDHIQVMIAIIVLCSSTKSHFRSANVFFLVDVANTSSILSLSQTLYTYPDSFRAAKALIAAQYSRSTVKVVSEPPEFELGKTNKTPEFLAQFPLGKVSECEVRNLWIQPWAFRRYPHSSVQMGRRYTRAMPLHTTVSCR